MNHTPDEINRLKEMLEAATTAGGAAVASGNPETIALRETWLAFGQLLEAAEQSAPPPAVVVSLDPLPSPAAGQLVRMPQSGRLARRHAALFAATAAAILALLSVAVWYHRGSLQNRDQPSVAQTPDVKDANRKPAAGSASPVVVPIPERPGGAIAQAPAKAPPSATPGSSTASTWEDPLETQIALVSQQIAKVEQKWQRRVDEVDVVQYGIDDLNDLLRNDTL